MGEWCQLMGWYHLLGIPVDLWCQYTYASRLKISHISKAVFNFYLELRNKANPAFLQPFQRRPGCQGFSSSRNVTVKGNCSALSKQWKWFQIIFRNKVFSSKSLFLLEVKRTKYISRYSDLSKYQELKLFFQVKNIADFKRSWGRIIVCVCVCTDFLNYVRLPVNSCDKISEYTG